MSFTPIISDEELILLIKRKDPRAFSSLYDKFAAPLYGVICKLVKNESLAKQVLHDSFICIWEQQTSVILGNEKLFITMHNITRDTVMEALNKYRQQEKSWLSTDQHSLQFVRAIVN